MSEELTTTEAPGVPALAYNPASEITAEDIPTPWVLFAQQMTGSVADGEVPYGAIYSQVGGTVTVLADPPKEKGVAGPGVTFYVLRGPIKRYGYTNKTGDYWTSDDFPNLEDVDQSKGFPHRVFDYIIGIPDKNQIFPFKVRFKRTGADAAKAINMAILERSFASKQFDAATIPFTLTLTKKTKDTYNFVVPSASVAEVPAPLAAKHQEVLAVLRERAGAPPAQLPTASVVEAPAIN